MVTSSFICISAVHNSLHSVSFLSRVDELTNLACLPCKGLHSSDWRALQGKHRAHGFESRWSLFFFFRANFVIAMVTSSFNFIIVFSFLATSLYYHLFLWWSCSHDPVLQWAYCICQSYVVLHCKKKNTLNTLSRFESTLKRRRGVTEGWWLLWKRLLKMLVIAQMTQPHSDSVVINIRIHINTSTIVHYFPLFFCLFAY